MENKILLAGFGGQGILFAGKFLAFEGLFEGKEVSWLPSYGPEMRGGTASCSVIISDKSIGSPIISNPDVLIAMNLPSLDKYEAYVPAGGHIIVDSALIERKVERTDVSVHYIPATRLASDENLQGLANMIILGYMIKNTKVISYENIATVMEKFVSAKKPELLGLNKKAIELGYNYNGEK